MNNTRLPDQETFVAALCAAHPEYVKAGAAVVYAQLAKEAADIQAAAMARIGGEEVPDLQAEGRSVSSLKTDFGLNPLAALLTIGWLRRDPKAAEKAMRLGSRNPAWVRGLR